jgi:hypothetical protein
MCDLKEPERCMEYYSRSLLVAQDLGDARIYDEIHATYERVRRYWNSQGFDFDAD